MSTFNFNDKEDCQEFIALILDNYCPKQLEGIDATVLEDAVRSCKENGFELTGNNLYRECCYIATNNLVSRLEDIKNYEIEDYYDELNPYEIDCIEDFLNDTDRFELGNGLIECYCNGSLDSSIWIYEDVLSSREINALQKLNELTGCFTDFQNEISYVKCLDDLLMLPIELEINEPDICD